MKLNISKNEAKEGLVFKKKIYEMWVSCELTPEELEAYKSVKDEIGNMLVAEYELDGVELNLCVKDLIYTHTKKDGKGFRFRFEAQHEMSAKEDEVKEGAKGLADYLKRVKSGAALGDESVEF